MSLLFILVFKLPVWFLAISFSISMSLHTILLLILLYKKLGGFSLKPLIYETVKIVVATFNTSVLTYFLLRVFDGLIFDTSRTINVFLLLVVSSGFYALIYLFLTWVFGIQEIYLLTKMLLKVREYQRKVVEVYKGVE